MPRREFRELHFDGRVASFNRQFADIHARYAALTNHEHLVVGTHNLPAAPERPVALGGSHGNKDLVAWFKRVLMPTDPNQVARTQHFDPPVFGFAFIIFKINIELRVGIDPYEIRHGRLNRDSLGIVVASSFAVVRKRSGGNQQNTHCQ